MTTEHTAPGGQDLRIRRRRQTTHDVSGTALLLFSTRGFASTTVEEIAAEAGISPRTFFRYFATKEDAALFGFIEIDDALDQLHLAGTDPEAAVSAIQSLYSGLLEDMQGPRLERFVQVQRLTETVPSIRHAADSRFRDMTRKICDVLVEALGPDRTLEARVAAEVQAAVLHAALDDWSNKGPYDHSALTSYRAALRVLDRKLSPTREGEEHSA